MPGLLKGISLTFFTVLLVFCEGFAQKIVDPCFASISPLGKFNDSEDIINLCRCTDNFDAANLIEWDGTKWQGSLTHNTVKPPPAGCSVRALWVGYRNWTINGEAFALRLDGPLQAGTSYSFTFTYAKDGNSPLDGSDADEFSPIVYTDKSIPSLYNAFKVGRLPPTVDWATNSITFTATSQQAGHTWIILHGVESSGTILSNCIIENPISNSILSADTTICIGDELKLNASENDDYEYKWNTGSTKSSIVVNSAGTYSVEVQYGTCNNTDSITVNEEDCEVRMVMPNVITPNAIDTLNSIFKPMEYNYIKSGTVSIYNRLGKQIFNGDVFKGWDGLVNGHEAPAAVYYYIVFFEDRNKNWHSRKGPLTVMK